MQAIQLPIQFVNLPDYYYTNVEKMDGWMSEKYAFHWFLLGDITSGRPFLGKQTSLEAYRLMQFTLRDILEKRLGAQATDEIFYDAGHLAGEQFFHNLIGKASSFDVFLNRLQELLSSLKIGILRVEKVDLENGEIILTISEDLDCSGLPELDYEICIYDEGFISGVLESFTGRKFNVKEIDCWCTGDRTCRFRALEVL